MNNIYRISLCLLSLLYCGGLRAESVQNNGDSVPDISHPSVVLHTLSDDEMPPQPQSDRPAPTYAVSSHVPVSVKVNSNNAVGEIQIESGSTPLGAKTYRVPVNVCPGLNGFQPNLALYYNSMQGFSPVGAGWSLEGLSVISRSGKNISFHGKTEGVVMNNTDSFMLDGMMLIKISDQSSSGLILYESEQGNIKAKGHVSGETMKWLEVFYPNGNRGVYGDPDWSDNRLFYPLVSLSDIHDNKIVYEYTYSGGNHYIDRIRYNGASVEFYYDSGHTSCPPTYCGGKKVEHSKMLAGITCKNGSVQTGSYSLVHTNYTGTPHLDEVSYSCSGKNLNPLKFYYGDGNTIGTFSKNTTILGNYYTYDLPESIKTVRGKFDYFTKSDGVISLPNKNPYVLHHRDGGLFNHSENYFSNQYNGSESILLYTDIGESFAITRTDLVTGPGFVDILCADIEGKQDESIIRINDNISGTEDRIDFNVYKYTLRDGFTKDNAHSRSFKFHTVYEDNAGNKSTQPRYYYSGDFNGDGKMEIMSISVHNPFGEIERPTRCCIYDLGTGRLLHNSHPFAFKVDFSGSTDSHASDRLFVIDYDGDGKSDICHINKDGYSIYTFDVTDSGLFSKLIHSGTEINLSGLEKKDIIPGDLNGDGLTDLAVSPLKTIDGGSVWNIYYSMGDGRFDKTSCPGAGVTGHLKTKFVLHDINGDGKSDLIRWDPINTETYIYTENGFINKGIIENPSDAAILIPVSNTSRNTFPGLLLLDSHDLVQYCYSRNNISDNLLTGAVNSLGVIEKNDYGFINHNGIESGLYVKGTDASYPYINIIEPVPVIASTETFFDGESINESGYQYTNAIFHRQGRGFCGFEEIKVTDAFEKSVVREYEPFRHGMLKCETSPSGKVSYYNREDVSVNKTCRLLVDKKEVSDFLKDASATTTYAYNSYGYPVEENTATSDNISVKTVIEYSNHDDVDDMETGYMLGMLTSRTVTSSRGNSVYTTREEIPAYSRGLPTGKKAYTDGNRVEETAFSYDSSGNLIKESSQQYDSPSTLHKTYSHDSCGRLLKETDATGLSTQYAYDSRGLVSASTDCRGNVTSYEYDSFGREIKRCCPDSTVRTVTYAWETTDNGGLYSVSETQTGKPDVKRYYDAFNREVRTEETRFDGSTIKTDREYDYKGNLIAESMPYKSGSPSLWTTFDYDQYDRLVCRTEPTGRQISYAYSGSSVTEDDGIKSKTCDYDSAGNLISVSDSEGIIDFILGADGQKESIVIDDGSGTDYLNTTYGYDRYRRVTSVNDPSQGETLTEYDESGNIASQTDANGETVSFEHDIYGRLTKKIFPEFETTYTYNDYNELVARNSTNGTFKHFTFDGLGRLVSEKEGGVSAWLQKDYTYADGNVGTITYTSNHGKLTTETYAYANGHLKEVKISDGQSIYRLEEENSLGKPTRAMTGEILRMYDYDDYGFPTKRYAESEDQIYQYDLYEFDPQTSNLNRRCVDTGYYEYFEYDSQDRLTCFDGETVTYHTNGNINDKSDVGYYQYKKKNKPYAVSVIMPFDGTEESKGSEQDIEYTSFSRPAGISENGVTAHFEYNADGDRVRTTVTKDRSYLERHYLGGCYECDDVGPYAHNYLEKLYLMGDFYSAPSVLLKLPYELEKADTIPMQIPDSLIHMPVDPIPVDPLQPCRPLGIGNGPDVTWLDYFLSGKPHKSGVHQILRDYLGSINHVIQPDGTEVENLGYDAWGRVRLTEEKGRYMSETDPPLYLGRGYTGHEHLPLFGLVNMNARLYDPMLGRFLSPDPYIAFADWLQSYNRYSYALNNPLCYIDQDGEVPIIVAFALIGGMANIAANWETIQKEGFWSGVKYFGIGAVAGAVGSVAGAAMASAVGACGFATALTSSAMVMTTEVGFLGGGAIGFADGLASGFILGTGNSLLHGEEFGHSIVNGINQGWRDGLTAGITNGILSGLSASQKGGNFWTGSKPSPLNYNVNLDLPSESKSEKGTYTVYYGYELGTDGKEVKRYIGITSRDPIVRYKEHWTSDSPRKFLSYKEFENLTNLTKLEARICEQYFINKYTLKRLLNKRNEISPKYWENYPLLSK